MGDAPYCVVMLSWKECKMKLGIVGTGMIARMVGPNLKSWGVEVVAIAGTPASMDEVNGLADEWGVTGRYADYHDLALDPNVDTVYVAVPNFLHYAVSEAAILAGKDVVCEKPLASNHEGAKKLADLAKREGRFLWEGVVTTRQPYFKTVRDELLEKIELSGNSTICIEHHTPRSAGDTSLTPHRKGPCRR